MHDRSSHEASCPCNVCIAYDIAGAQQEGLNTDGWKPGGLEWLLKTYRHRKLNWDLESGHCLVCGGTKMYAHLIEEHHIIKRWNVKQTPSLYLCSLLVHKLGARVAVVKHLSHDPLKLRAWASHMQDLLPEKCLGLNARDIGDWFEIRLAYEELVEDPIERRIERRWRESGQKAHTSASPG